MLVDRPKILIRADASLRIGTGHIMRMIALAQACLDRGVAVTIACVNCPDAIAGRARGEGIGFEKIGDDTLVPGSADDLAQTVTCAKSIGAKWVVLDGYHFDISYQRGLRNGGLQVLAVDDYGHCNIWAADAVLNQNIFAPKLNYSSEVEGCRFLLGTRFALLRREFRVAAPSQRAVGTGISSFPPRSIYRLLITLGGVDVDNVTGRLLAALNCLAFHPIEIKLIAGAGNPHLDSLKKLALSSPHSVDVFQNVLDMPALYQWAEGVISAGGSTCWEWLFYHLPAAVVCLADNQRPIIAGLATHGLAIDLGWHADLEPASTANRLHDWLNGSIPRPDVPPQVAVDAMGAERVASLLDGTNIWLHRARSEDARLWFEWANDAAVRANGFHPDPIPWETHLDWFERHRRSPDSRLWIGFNLDEEAVGYVRLHRSGGDEWEVGVAVAPAHRGQNLGQRLVGLALRQFQVQRDSEEDDKASRDAFAATIVARIKPGNSASLNLFQAIGFQCDPARNTADCCLLTYKLAK
jgi:UDP-2,4-diacetamido-2,4,6-trideoxy-beta-L-altropyranose hydrolase